MAAQLTHESSSGLEGTKCARDRSVRVVLDPVQHGIGKYRIEFVLKGQSFGIHYSRVESTRTRSRNHVLGIVYAYHLRTQCNQFFGQRSVAASQIKNPLARLR